MGDWWDVGDFSFDGGDFGGVGDYSFDLGGFDLGGIDAGFDPGFGQIGGGDFASFFNAANTMPDWAPTGAMFNDVMGGGAGDMFGLPDWATAVEPTGGAGLDVMGQPMQQIFGGSPYNFGVDTSLGLPAWMVGGGLPDSTINLGQLGTMAGSLAGPAAGAAMQAAGGGSGAQGTPVQFRPPTTAPALPGTGAPQQGLLNSLLSPQGVLGAAGLAAGLGGALASGGQTGSNRSETMPALIPERASIGPQANAAWTGMQPFAQGMTPLQQQQNSLLGALASGQGLPPGYAQLVEQAFEPAFGDVATQAIESARRRGFAGGAGLLQEGPAGAIAGPALANLQGQMAQAKLGLMQTLPGLYNTPIQTQGGFQNQMGQGLNQLGASYPSGNQVQGSNSVPMWGQVGNMVNNALTGFGGAIAQQQQQQQQQNMLSQFFPQNYNTQQQPQGGGGNGGVGGMSYWGV